MRPPVSLNTRSMGTMPLLVPLVPRMYEPVARMLCMDRPMPPADLEMQAHSLSVS
jgi:hypothetical protein